MLFVDDYDEGYALLLLRAASEVVERRPLFGVAYHHRIILVDALPVYEEYLAGMDIAFG